MINKGIDYKDHSIEDVGMYVIEFIFWFGEWLSLGMNK